MPVCVPVDNNIDIDSGSGFDSQARSCSDPGSPKHGYKLTPMVGMNYENGNVIGFACNDGYLLKGSSEIKCENSVWSDDLPFCSGFSVTCSAEDIQVIVLKEYIEYIDASLLSLQDSSCRPKDSETHIEFMIPLKSCGTRVEETDEYFVYSNVLRTPPVPSDSPIKRYPDILIPFQCQYPRRISNNLVHKYEVVNGNTLIDSDAEMGEFHSSLTFYHDNDFSGVYDTETPVTVRLREDVFFGIDVSGNGQAMAEWKMKTETCRGSSSLHPTGKNDEVYTLFDNGCPVDASFRQIQSDNPLGEKFAMQSFRFKDYDLGNEVYIHCDIILCNRSDTHSACDVDCETPELRRRRSDDSMVKTISVSKGPLILLDDDVDEDSTHKTGIFKAKAVGAYTGVIVVGVILLIGLTLIVSKKTKEAQK
ncbi:ZP domain-containing protein-like [Saccoglossus kowalevskii]|uniref:Oncoprotein-induced transcript 3 protein-like n=1 Tax=Saccoglossus kowalevskii TaxID=10224 RepID=A0ABM0MVT0_SACKO|nr:PREDICTED: oncoprotein-induced transcript 3 protein-like [Saccoglossus kowalevskii]